MTKIKSEEIRSISHIAKLKISDNNISLITKQIGDILEYATTIPDIKLNKNIISNKNINVFRDNNIEKYDSQKLLEQAPQREDNFFIVPKVINN
jgi:aspartyl-tRNA(Asn)/glutamyl-tRNA(Gln) amidotransferase subunit C